MTNKRILLHTDDANEEHLDIIARCIAGDEGAFKFLYDLFANAMYNTGYRILNNRVEAEDIVQESFVAAFKNISGFQNRSSFGTWLKRIVIHKCINLTKKKKLNLVELKINYVESIPEDTEHHEEEIQWEVNKILQGIELLPENYRIVVNLYLIEGYDHEEIAQIMDLSEATIRTQYIRGKKKLADFIKTNLRR